jgi:Brp/Blh family beta-carotene 15,15'-monooxygenase
VLLLSGFILFRWTELEALLQASPDIQALQLLLSPGVLIPIAGLAAVLLFIILFKMTLMKEMARTRIMKELFVLAVLAYSFYIFPLVMAFALYFCILHSLRVLYEEYRELSSKGVFSTMKEFFYCMAPLTMISYAGLGMLFWVHTTEVLPMSDLKMVFIMTSLITLPHCFVMEFFYGLRSSERNASDRSSFPSSLKSSGRAMDHFIDSDLRSPGQ